jgi:hypothetical protein
MNMVKALELAMTKAAALPEAAQETAWPRAAGADQAVQ